MNILLIYGGKSCEHDISIITACLAKGYFDGNLYCAYMDYDNKCYLVPTDYTPVMHTKAKLRSEISFTLGSDCICVGKGIFKKKIKIDVAVNCCHGVNGEDGAVAGLCALMNLPCVGSGVIASGVAMDKALTKYVLKGADVPALDGFAIVKSDLESGRAFAAARKLGFPVIIKPCTLGSSIGIEVVKDESQFKTSVRNAFLYDGRLLIEKALCDFYELNCSAMTKEGKVIVSAVERPYTTGDILSFEDKYVRGGKGFDPKSDKEEITHVDEVKQLTEKVYKLLNMSGVVRVDFIIDKPTGKLYVNEINTIPGSLAYNLWRGEYKRMQFGRTLTDEAVREYLQTDALKRQFKSEVLTSSGGKKR
ncbi:MAG: ATP-grasp domain-containing protein [Corallococcus sp.]|nr:ATP-grasp domain-containing protein [Corallococcus sp.]